MQHYIYNYKRSQARLVKLIKEVFAVLSVSTDTKVIVLVLAGTLPRSRFNAWIDGIAGLNPLHSHLKEINALRCQYGDNFRNYILVRALQAAKQDVSADELIVMQQSELHT